MSTGHSMVVSPIGGLCADICDCCLVWDARHRVTMQALYDLTLHIRQVDLRETVLEHMTLTWMACLAAGGHPRGVEGFVDDYCRDVERDADPALHNSEHHRWELHR